MKHNFKDIFALYQKISAEKAEVRYPYYHLNPVVITSERMEKFRKLQKLLLKAFHYYVRNYQKYEHVVTHADHVHKIVEICQKYEYKVGSFRPDYLVDTHGGIKICEINARYFEAFFLQGLTEYIMEKKTGCVSYIDGKKPIEAFLETLFEYWGNFERVVVLKGMDREGDIRYYRPFFEELGIEFVQVKPADICKNLNLLEGSGVISAMSQMELDTFPLEAIEALSASKIINRFSTIYLLHDKRFLALLYDNDFQEKIYNKEEKEFIFPYLIPTYTRKQNPEIWEIARSNREGWILKPQLLGKSEGIVPGPLVSDQEWESVFDSPKIEKMILQSMIDQRTFTGKISEESKIFTDYATGTLLCFNDSFFGPAEFRATSQTVVNLIKDDRKIGTWLTDEYQNFKGDYFIL